MLASPISALELVQANGLWHRIAWHLFEYQTARNLNATACGLRLVNPPFRAFSWENRDEQPSFDSLPLCQDCIALPPFWAD